MDFASKSEELAKKMNALTKTFDVSDEMVISGNDIIEHVEEKTKDISLFSSDVNSKEVIDLHVMMSDFKFVRDTLKESTENGRRVLSAVTLDLLSEDGEDRRELISAFAELNNAIANNMKLYTQSYKDIAHVLSNIDKLGKDDKPTSVTNNLTIHEAVSTADVLKKLKEL